MNFSLRRHDTNPVLAANPANSWEAGTVFNPCVVRDGGIFRMLYRATPTGQWGQTDKYASSIGMATSTDGINFERSPQPLLSPDQEYERGMGCEDPRAVKVGDTWYIFYNALRQQAGERRQVQIAVATTRDFETIEKHGPIITAGPRSKAAALLPDRIGPNGDRYGLLWSWATESPLGSILLTEFDSLDELLKPPAGKIAQTLEQYSDHLVLAPPVNAFRGPELGAPPLRTDDGWLLIYCGANTANHPEWTISAALLDLDDPRRIIGNLDRILVPETPGELHGVVDNVTFPGGAVVVGEELYVYYGSGDNGCCLATGSLAELLAAIKQAGPPDPGWNTERDLITSG